MTYLWVLISFFDTMIFFAMMDAPPGIYRLDD